MTYLFNVGVSNLASYVMEHLTLFFGGLFLFLLGMFVVQQAAHSLLKKSLRGVFWCLRNRYVLLFLCVPLGMGLHIYLSMVLNQIVDAQAQLGLTSDAPAWYTTEEGATLLYNSMVTSLMFLAAFLPRYWAKCVAALVTGHGLATMGLVKLVSWGNIGLSQYLSLSQQIEMVAGIALAIALTVHHWSMPNWRLPAFKLALPKLRRWKNPLPPIKPPFQIKEMGLAGEKEVLDLGAFPSMA